MTWQVGTGLGPTLEFYALVSRELQRVDLELWHDESGGTISEGGQLGYVFSSVGLFPAPISRASRVSQVVKLKTKFKFIGKFMAKAVMDSRMVSILAETGASNCQDHLFARHFWKISIHCIVVVFSSIFPWAEPSTGGCWVKRHLLDWPTWPTSIRLFIKH